MGVLEDKVNLGFYREPDGRLSQTHSESATMEGIHSGMEPGVRDLIIAWRIQISSISTLAGGGPIDDSDSESASDSDPPGPDNQVRGEKGIFQPPPTLEQVETAARDLENILRPPRKDKTQSYKDVDLDKKTKKRLQDMHSFCINFIRMENRRKENLKPGSSWTLASVETAQILGYGTGKKKSENLRKWVRTFIEDREKLPTCNWQTSGRSLIDDEDFAQEIHQHLQSLKPEDIRAEAIVKFLDDPEMLTRLQRKKTISLKTAQTWMKKMCYRWSYDPKGQYVDGHERPDVVEFRNAVFLPAIEGLLNRTTKWDTKNETHEDPPLADGVCRIVIWYHDESTFYAHDRRTRRWIHKDENAKPYAKGEGHSLMVADFVSAEYGWMRSRDGNKTASVLFQAGKAREGYFNNENIRAHLNTAAEILKQDYPDEDHVLIFDNAKTHVKRPEGSLSALRMPKGPSPNFMVEVNDVGEDGKLKYTEDGKIQKKKIPMSNGNFNGREQEFYWPENSNHPFAGQFKGMVQILEERGFRNASKLKAQCRKKFSDCSPEKNCCCRRLLFNQPDFALVESILEKEAKALGLRVIFLPKFHCELNPIEQCWGYAKRLYRLSPPSSTEADLEKNTVRCLDAIPLMTMRR